MQANLQTVNSINIGTTKESKTFTISTSPEFFQILSGSLYKDSIKAVIRETVTNAWDAHLQSNWKGYIDVTYQDNVLTVTDYGRGIPHEDIYDIYCTYGKSTKNQTTLTGGFGLGCKAPFALGSSFIVENNYNGIKKTYSLSIKDGIPTIDEVFTSETNHHGLTVKINLNNTPLYKVEAYLKQLAFLGGMKIRFNKENLLYFKDNLGRLVTEPGVYVVPRYTWDSSYVVRYGNNFYSLEKTLTTNETREILSNLERLYYQYNYRDYNILIIAEPNTLSVTPSRESLKYDDNTKLYIERVLNRVIEEATSNLKSKFNCIYQKLGKNFIFDLSLGFKQPYFKYSDAICIPYYMTYGCQQKDSIESKLKSIANKPLRKILDSSNTKDTYDLILKSISELKIRSFRLNEKLITKNTEDVVFLKKLPLIYELRSLILTNIPATKWNNHYRDLKRIYPKLSEIHYENLLTYPIITCTNKTKYWKAFAYLVSKGFRVLSVFDDFNWKEPIEPEKKKVSSFEKNLLKRNYKLYGHIDLNNLIIKYYSPSNVITNIIQKQINRDALTSFFGNDSHYDYLYIERDKMDKKKLMLLEQYNIVNIEKYTQERIIELIKKDKDLKDLTLLLLISSKYLDTYQSKSNINWKFTRDFIISICQIKTLTNRYHLPYLSKDKIECLSAILFFVKNINNCKLIFEEIYKKGFSKRIKKLLRKSAMVKNERGEYYDQDVLNSAMSALLEILVRRSGHVKAVNGHSFSLDLLISFFDKVFKPSNYVFYFEEPSNEDCISNDKSTLYHSNFRQWSKYFRAEREF